ncbi:hypothetical protein BJ508DRAFT_418731 [Ascobolus immersus RN42]|uniref:PNPLA domain-containing protein n=1 Tax=Ascobolus immersus RN42 TaxID=1160509 RepID=A0A3N4HKA0_ASCIM|nr:hypothetical protein BJ508DRAFT_418731 [Ascobolus immersus RN42]
MDGSISDSDAGSEAYETCPEDVSDAEDEESTLVNTWPRKYDTYRQAIEQEFLSSQVKGHGSYAHPAVITDSGYGHEEEDARDSSPKPPKTHPANVLAETELLRIALLQHNETVKALRPAFSTSILTDPVAPSPASNEINANAIRNRPASVLEGSDSGKERVPGSDGFQDLHNRAVHSETDEVPGPSTRSSTPFSYTTSERDFSTRASSTSTRRTIRICDDCERPGSELAACNVCQQTYCSSCWDRQATHKRRTRGPGGVPHEKTDPVIAQKINQILDPEPLEVEEQELQHVEDFYTKWFGVVRDDNGQVMFQNSGRFESIMESVRDTNEFEMRYPSLVSFVGQTGAGKSTLIKALVEINTGANQNSDFQTPIVGTVETKEVPTSSEVHLYSDPNTINTQYPLLFADCEGLEGGNREPITDEFMKKLTPKSAQGLRPKLNTKLLQSSKGFVSRPVTWAKNKTKQAREFAVENMYPRLLYAFSDVIVFVTKNPKVIETVFEKLIEWALVALENSSNQPTLPFALIVLNATDNAQSDELWEPENTTRRIFESMDRIVSLNPKFVEWATFWRKRGRTINTVEDLLNSYYSGVRVISVPERGRPTLINRQFKLVYDEIKRMSEWALHRKLSVRMLLTEKELLPYLNYAFDHFSLDLDLPFDFVEASFRQNPIPGDFGGGILKLLLSLLEHVPSGWSIRDTIRYTAPMIASAIMLDSSRSKTIGAAENIFPEYITHLENAFDEFCSRHYPCEYESRSRSKPVRCVNVSIGHSKGHQSKDGKVIGTGPYESSLSDPTAGEFFKAIYFVIFFRLRDMLAHLHRTRQVDVTESEERLASKLHRTDTLSSFYTLFGGLPQSNSVCFACLTEQPKYPLVCGHVICEPCLKSYGTMVNVVTYEVSSCPICGNGKAPWNVPVTVHLQPEDAGVRILSLDGGGIRGVIQLETLRQIEQVVGLGIPIQEFFDLIVGTSCGGLIALGLGVKGWSVQEAQKIYKQIVTRAFRERTGNNVPFVGKLIQIWNNNSKYVTKDLEDAYRDYFEETPLFGCFGDGERVGCRVAVTSIKLDHGHVILTNYLREDVEQRVYKCFRPEKLEHEILTWEAARATSAAPTYFRPYQHAPTNQVFQDGALHYNNPIAVAHAERLNLWPSLSAREPDILLSIGTGNPALKKRRAERLGSSLDGGLSGGFKQLLRIAFDALDSTLDSNSKWDDFYYSLSEENKWRYTRLNLNLQRPPELDEVRAIPELEAITKDALMRDPQIKEIAHRLVASLFYFTAEKISTLNTFGEDGDQYQCTGYITCRLPNASASLAKLASKLQFSISNPCFSITTSTAHTSLNANTLTFPLLEDSIRTLQYRPSPRSIWKFPVSFTVPTASSRTTISFLAADRPAYPISGFPRDLVLEFLHRTESPTIRRKQSTKLWRTHPNLNRTGPDFAAVRNQWTPSMTVDAGTFEVLGSTDWGEAGMMSPGSDWSGAGVSSPTSPRGRMMGRLVIPLAKSVGQLKTVVERFGSADSQEDGEGWEDRHELADTSMAPVELEG